MNAVAVLAIKLALVHLAVSTSVQLDRNGYDGLVIAINPSVPEDPQLIANLKAMWTDASSVLYEATEHRAYFRNITILVPTSWSTGSYGQAYTENYDDADVIVADPNPLYGEVPYTLQFGGCGEMGEYIHLTPEFINSEDFETNYGPKEKTLVKGWAHYRWGVFDEAATGDFDKYYWDSDEFLQATRDSLSLEGQNVNYKTGDVCAFNQITGLPEDDCVFVVNEVQEEGVSSSLMSHQYVDQVTHFSAEDNHNTEAPNEQNRLCDQQSTWAVIKSSEDFNGGSINLPTNIAQSDLTPTFKVVQHHSDDKRFVLVLDSSGSMSGAKFSAMKSSTISFINSAPETSSFGLVDFDSSAWILANLTAKDDETSKDYLVGQMSHPSFLAGGGTNIDGGVWKGLEVFENDPKDSSGGVMIVLTDGQGTIGASTQDCLDAEVTVNTIFLGVSVGNDELQKLCDVTNGKWCIVNDVSDTAALRECFNKFLSESFNDGDSSQKLHQIHSRSLTTTSSSTVSGTVAVDSTVGRDTVFTFTWAYSSVNPEIYLFDPQNLMYCSSEYLDVNCAPSIVSNDTDYNTITFTIPGLASVGQWTYSIQTFASYDTVSVTVTSYQAESSLEPIDVKSGLSVNEVANLTTPVSVFAQVRQGLNPILDATVIATVTDPYGSKVDLSLKDSGAGADTRKNDGIYTKYYTGFHAAGRYSVQVTVTGYGNSTNANGTFNLNSALGYSVPAFRYGKVAADGTVTLNKNSPSATAITGGVSSGVLESFERIASPQGLEYTGVVVDMSVDSYPPSQVLDLKAMQKNISDISQGFVVTFSAPGNNYDEGRATGYEIRYTTDEDTSILRSSFDSQLLVSSDDFIMGSSGSPSLSGENEYFVINLSGLTIPKNTIRVGIALRAFDESGNYGKVSNVVVMSVFKTSPLLWSRLVLSEDCMDENRRYISRGPFAVEEDCASFYKCSNGYRSLHNCPSNLLFNPSISVCDWPINVQCGKSLEDTKEKVKEPCKDESGGLITGGPYKQDDDCSVYYMCSSGYKTTQYCVPGLVFNQAISACDWPANVPGC